MNIALRPNKIPALHFPSLSHITFKCLCTISHPLHNPKNPNSIESSLVQALKSISSSPSLISHGQQLHCLILKSGLNSNVFIQNSLISMYSKTGLFSCAKSIFYSSQNLDYVSCNIMLAGYVKYGNLKDAHHVFVKMPLRNCVSYTTMIMGFAQNEYYWDAIGLYREMRLSGVVPAEVTMASVIQSYARVNSGEKRSAKFLHGLVLKLGLDRLVIVSTNLILVYCANSCLGDARLVFDEMVDRNVVTWNVMLNGYVKAGLVDSGRELFDGFPEKDVVSWGTMIDGYVQIGKLREALAIYREMRHTGLAFPNEVMIVDIISSCGQATKLVEGQQFHALAVKLGFNRYDFMQATLIHFYGACRELKLARLQFEEGNKDHVACWNALISSLMKNGMLDDASRLFGSMPERDIFSWSSMISGYSQNGELNLAIELFHEMVDKGIKPNEITMVGVFSAISGLGALNEGKWAHDYIYSNSIPISDNLSAAIIDMYAKCGSINSAQEAFYQFREKTKEVSPWNAIICGLAMHGHADMSLRIFSDLQARKINLNSITFIGVLSACCHAGLVEEGEEYFKSMRTVYGLEPNIKHYGCMVDLLGRAGRLKEAEELVKSMPMEADVIIWGTLLAACRVHGDTDIGERVAENLAKVEPSHGPSRVLLSNIYADVGRWDDAFLVRRAMQTGKMSRSPGYSGIV
ncbi:pentatricopeptide repeat-containing protein at5g19020 mitochondrial [Phtheirospermum japonicum]|uniref:Pentatricopeptide repeat-containing protein at5g19020 mitochondrial n=1 Tax=Phtheirospermum japonicum TaxID=374723 RepID=A0A830BFR1_9LAMI|nr:pentatricopeptide repeat-containing protein at5g19020 mitochondrial [Phtheirospermum japonicum]